MCVKEWSFIDKSVLILLLCIIQIVVELYILYLDNSIFHNLYLFK